jgi:predicted ABC-type transport system involved in lysophospholipase L1 biosynthesis ATPase subunit
MSQAAAGTDTSTSTSTSTMVRVENVRRSYGIGAAAVHALRGASPVPVPTAAENAGVPLRLRRAEALEREERIELLLSLVGLADHAAQRLGELSGGRRQRVAIARALADDLAPLIADEPTGRLDAETGHTVLELPAVPALSEAETVEH